MKRREFLRLLGVAGATTAVAGKPSGAAAEPPARAREFMSILVDTTHCVACRLCETACAEANGLPVPSVEDKSVVDTERKTSPEQLNVVNRCDTSKGKATVKLQCMHCNQPACAAACLTRAMLKTRDGPVIWRKGKCMGCRFCMVSCPFDMPKFEYDSAMPEIRKCSMCWTRLGEGLLPACVEACPREALRFGSRRQLLDRAYSKIYEHPRRYVHQVYGEHEVGGTGYLYLSAVPFEEMGLNTKLGTTAFPELTTGFLYSVPLVFLLWPAILLAIQRALKRDGQDDDADSGVIEG